MKSENIIQGVIHSPEALASAVGETARLKVEHAAALSEMELEIAAVQKRHQPRLLALGRQIALREAGVFTYCQQHRETLFGAKRSLDLLPGTIGFRTTPPRVERVNSKDQWSTVALRLAALEWGRDYLHDALPEVNKERLLAHRHKLTAGQLAQAGLKFEQDENFFITPGSEQTAPTSIRQAA